MRVFLAQVFAHALPSELPSASGTTEVDVRLTADLHLGKMRVEFEGSDGLLSIGSAMHNLVMGQSLPRGDDPGYSWLCFTVAHGSYSERWRLMSDSDFGGGPDYAITGIFVEQLKPSLAPRTTCPETPPQFLPASLDKHLWVGSGVAAIKSLFGLKLPSRGWHRYSNVTKRVDSRGTEWFVHSWLDIKVEDGVIVALRAVQRTSS